MFCRESFGILGKENRGLALAAGLTLPSALAAPSDLALAAERRSTNSLANPAKAHDCGGGDRGGRAARVVGRKARHSRAPSVS